MTLDAYDLTKLFAPPLKDEFLRGRFGTIKQVNSNGTADVLLDGSTSTQRFANWGGAQVGSRCIVESKGTDWFIAAASGLGSSIECANFCVEASENKNPNAGWVWEKYADGTAKCWRNEFLLTIQPSGGRHPDAYGTYYGSASGFPLYPFEFLEKPDIVGGGYCVSNTLATINFVSSSTVVPSGMPISPQVFAANTPMLCNIYVFGRYAVNTTQELPATIAYRPVFETTAVPVPVGGIYETLDPADPATIWPGTAWEALGVGRTTVGAGGSYTAGGIGGSNTLSESQMPSHWHEVTSRMNDNGTQAGGKFGINRSADGGTNCYNLSIVGTINVGASGTMVGALAKGGGQPHEHPYIVVYRWKRLSNVGAVAQLNLTEISQLIQQTNLAQIAQEIQSLRQQLNFVYTTTKKDTGRTSDDGCVIWGQKFVGSITQAVNTENSLTLLTNGNTIVLTASGWFDRGDGAKYMIPFSRNNSSAIGYCGVISTAGSTIVITLSHIARTNAPYNFDLDYTDGTQRSQQ
jgi:hypothetical protein